MQFEGIFTPIVAPYHDDFSCNEHALAQTCLLYTSDAADE